jgi:hypothetical protein
MRRREFITLIGGAAAAWPFTVRAQQGERMRRIGILLATTADDVEFQAWVGAFLQALALLGWTIGRNVRIDTRWAGAKADDIRKHAAELAALAPCRRPAQCQSCSRLSPIRSPRASSKAWRGRAATPLASPHSTGASARNGWNCLSKPHQA